MKARIRLHKLLSVLLCCIMLVGMLPTHAYAWDTESECDFCHEFIADDWICDGGNHCSESSGHTDCYDENHCQVCGDCRDDDWCGDCHMHIECAQNEGRHCSNCGACFDDVTPCPRCNETCSDCASDWCDECEMCVDCGIDANKHCPDCHKCTASAGCLVCHRCFDCGGMCDAGCDDLCLRCHLENSAACEGCGACYVNDDSVYCHECLLCADCAGSDICEECKMCKDCGIAANKHCPDCGECTASAGCLVCYRCFDCGGMCDAGCDDLCLRCHLENSAACEGCGACYVNDDSVYCQECLLCADCAGSDICADCKMCVECAIDQNKHCPGCEECLEQAESFCKTCYYCASCAEICPICGSACSECGTVCPDCGTCANCAKLCQDCGYCENCVTLCGGCEEYCRDCATVCESCGAHCSECGVLCPDCGTCKDCTALCHDCGRCGDCTTLCQNCQEYCADCATLCESCDTCENCAAICMECCQACSECGTICEFCGLCEDCCEANSVAAGCDHGCCVMSDEWEDHWSNKHIGEIPTHVAGSEWKSDTSNHWKVCKVNGCRAILGNTKAAHTASDWIIDTAATAATDGTKHKECTVCERVLETDTIPATGSDHTHSYGSEWKSGADKHWLECACGVKSEEAAHTAGDWITDTAATSTTAGTKHKECTECGYVMETGTIPATDSDHTHSYASEWKSGADKHWLECACGVKSKEAAHTAGDWITDTAATSTTTGTKHKECTECGYVMETGTIPATGSDHTHSYASEWKTDADKHWHECSCGAKDDVAAHTFKWVVDKEATATQKGSKHEECKFCGYQRPAVEIPATGSTTKPTDPAESNPNTGALDDVPQTVNNSNMILWIVLLLAFGLGVTGTVVYSKRKKYVK